MIGYPETNQFRDVIETVQKHSYRKRTFVGTIKLHGTNAAVVFDKHAGFHCQSRNHIISPAMDNLGFARFMYPLAERFLLERLLADCPILRRHYDRGDTIVVYGEWCGGSIQKNVALCALRRMFVIFKIRIGRVKPPVWIDPQHWSHLRWPEQSIYNIYDFPTYTLEIDFNRPELSRVSVKVSFGWNGRSHWECCRSK